jgi:hypothetical protein
MELPDYFVYRRGKGFIVILIHAELFFRFKQTEEREAEALKNICCARGKCENFDVIFTQKSEYLRIDIGTAVIHEQHSFHLRITWISPQ